MYQPEKPATRVSCVLAEAVAYVFAKPEDDQVEHYIVQKGDTLWEIAKRYYGNGDEYMRIFEANRSVLKDLDKIRPGQVLQIPSRAVLRA